MDAEEAITFEPEREELSVKVERIRQLKEVRENLAALKKIESALRDEVVRDLDQEGGAIVDEVSGLTARLITRSHFEWDAAALRATGELSDEMFSDLLVTTVDKKKLAELVSLGVVRERMIAPAKKETKAFEVVEIKERK